MNRALAVAKWEYVEKVTSKAFLISLFLMPVIMIGFGVLPTVFASRPDNEVKTIAVIDPSNQLIGPLAKALQERFKLPSGQPNYTVVPLGLMGRTSEQQSAFADSLALGGFVEGCLVIGDGGKGGTTFEYRSLNVGNIKLIERLNSSLRDVIIERNLRERHLDPSLVRQVTQSVDVRTLKLSHSGKAEESGFSQIFISAYIFMMMMFFLVITSGQMLVRSMLEEKSNRVVEVLLSSCSANDLMTGKIIGLSGLGLTQLGLWSVIGFAVSLKFGVEFTTFANGAILFVYFILGYLLYAGIFVALGAPVSTEQEAQQMTSYLGMILVMPIILAFPVLENPNSLMAKVLTFIPLVTPTIMALRIHVQMPSVVEIVGSMLLLGLSAFGMMWMAGKIFRTTILLTGKRPGIQELWRIVRTP